MISASILTARREKFAQATGTLIALTAHTALQQKSDMAHRFMQEPSFYYLTGINEADWQIIFDGKAWHLVEPVVSDSHKLFDGHFSREEAYKTSGIQSILSSSEGEILLHKLAKTNKKIATLGKDPSAKYYDFSLNPAPVQLFARLKRIFAEVSDCRVTLKKQRAIKTDEEVAVQQKAIDVTIDTFSAVKHTLAKKKFEYEIEADFNAAFRSTGAGGHAYDPIVASGKNACTLHYGANNDGLPTNGLVLIDVGAQVEGYAADITRTFAIGTPSPREKEIHAAVETAHKKIIALIKPDVSFEHYQHDVDLIMKTALQQVGLLYSYDDEKTYRKYFPHAISHGLGIDVHESLGGFGSFQAGMTLTVEPGIYIPEEGIGVRIEDDILVTEDGNVNLSVKLPTSL